jgi:rod shape-determining protein MreC
LGKKISALRSFGDLTRENKELNQRIISLEQELVSVRLHNEDLKSASAALNFAKSKNFNTVPARVVGRAKNAGLSFIIDKGSNSGIAERQVVITKVGILAGKITAVAPDFSIFRFVTDRGSRWSASISGNKNALGELRGELEVSLNLELIPRDIEIKSGDLIITAGLEQGVPEGLLVGRVIEVSSDPQNPLQRALIQPAANLADLRVVSVIGQESPQ